MKQEFQGSEDTCSLSYTLLEARVFRRGLFTYVRFLEGKEKDDKGRTIEDILGWEGKFFRLEFTQDYIQRIFPLPDGSQADKDVWPITAVELLELRNNEEAKGNIRRAYVMMLYFWKLDGDKYKDLSIKRHWVRRNGKDHNLFRISRVLKCLKLVHMSEYDDFLHAGRISSETFRRGTVPAVRRNEKCLEGYYL